MQMAVDFDIRIFRPPAAAKPLQQPTQPTQPATSPLQYARLRAHSTGRRVPRARAPPARPAPARFTLIVEPLLWGVLPRSLVPTLLALFAAVGVSSWLVPRVLSRLCHVAHEARAEADKKDR